MSANLYLLFFRAPDFDEEALDLHGDGTRLEQGLYFVQSELTRSKLYHEIKWQLPDDVPLLVAPLSEAPKFKSMEAGALKWLRERGVTGS